MGNRRELQSRKIKIFHHIAHYLAQKNITPNHISLASIVFALAGMVLLIFYGKSSPSFFLLLLAFITVQARLLCNLIDGLVAIEGSKKTASGEVFNDFPDRLSDIFFFVGMGFAAHSVILGFIAAIMAILTAYIRVLLASLDAPVSFKGPMAKQHRMAVLNICLLLAMMAVFVAPSYGSMIFKIGLIIIIGGCLLTGFNRLKQGYIYLENRKA